MKLTKNDKEFLAKEYSKVWRKRDGSVDEKMVDHCVKTTSAFVMFGPYIVSIDKPHIQTDFWFGERTYDYDEVLEECRKASQSEKFFKESNRRGCKAGNIIESIDADTCEAWLCHNYRGESNLAYVQFVSRYNPLRGNEIRQLTKDELQEYRQMCVEELEKFDKRLDTYLKRYGLTKCHFGTFWLDR